MELETENKLARCYSLVDILKHMSSICADKQTANAFMSSAELLQAALEVRLGDDKPISRRKITNFFKSQGLETEWINA